MIGDGLSLTRSIPLDLGASPSLEIKQTGSSPFPHARNKKGFGGVWWGARVKGRASVVNMSPFCGVRLLLERGVERIDEEREEEKNDSGCQVGPNNE